MDKVNNPHDRLIRETMSRKETAIDFFKNYLPENILELIDTGNIEISKDSFIEKELADFYSDILYKVGFKGKLGFVYLLFEHKSYEETFIQFQLIGYIHKIYSLYLKQTKVKKLPIILPVVLYHGRKKWEISTRFSAIIDGPYEAFKEYVPEFKYILFDLTQYPDERIKGEIHTQVVFLLLKHIFDPDLFEKLPGILSLLSKIIHQDTGLQTIEALLRYLFSTIEEKSVSRVKDMVQQALSNKKGEFVMGTIAEKYINEGIQQGIQQGMLQGLHQAIEMGLEIKFGNKGLAYAQKIKNINDIQKLQSIMKAIKIIKKLNELDQIIN